jgi:hypothetical protein
MKLFPFWIWGKLPFNLNWEFIMFHKLREFYDGITFFELIVNTDTYEELDNSIFHQNPKLDFKLIILNYTIFELNIYTVK